MIVRKYLTVLSGKYPANLYRIPDSAGCLNFIGYRYPDPAHPYCSLASNIVNQDHKEQAQKQHTHNARACMHT
jgi:hypothetical protein